MVTEISGKISITKMAELIYNHVSVIYFLEHRDIPLDRLRQEWPAWENVSRFTRAGYEATAREWLKASII